LEIMAKIRKVSKGGGTSLGLPTGFPDFDKRLGGLRNGEVILLASRPSMGKTSLALNLARNVEKATEKTVVFLSLEQSKEELMGRLLSSETRIDGTKVMGGRLKPKELRRLGEAEAALQDSRLIIDDNPGQTILDLRARARRLSHRFDVGLIVIDYLQLLTGHRRTESREQEVAQISQGLKALARELRLPVMALSQLSRAPEKRSNHRPRLADLRNSGSLEQDADVVVFIYRPEHYLTKEEAEEAGLIGAAELLIAKNRNGPTGTVPLLFRPQHMRFDSITRDIVGKTKEKPQNELGLMGASTPDPRTTERNEKGGSRR
jgi:replicative DNA helicase